MRKKAGQVFKEALERELKDLAMEKTVVQVQISQEKKLISPKGQDQVEFLISVNPGVPPKPLRKIASGGEISRIMLGIKSIFGDRDRIQTMIFDEIDTGISGRTAQAVAEKVFELSKTHQIKMCIRDSSLLCLPPSFICPIMPRALWEFQQRHRALRPFP